jgi:uncharacterized protein YaiI (UPF0178 family)
LKKWSGGGILGSIKNSLVVRLKGNKVTIMKIILDADACPVSAKQIAVETAADLGLRVIHVASVAHWSPEVEAHEVIWVDNRGQESDMVIANLVTPCDVVVTADFGLAALVLARRAAALSPRGFIYSEDGIERLLFERHLSAKVRRGGGKTKGPRGHSPADNQRFRKNLRKLLKSAD